MSEQLEAQTAKLKHNEQVLATTQQQLGDSEKKLSEMSRQFTCVPCLFCSIAVIV